MDKETIDNLLKLRKLIVYGFSEIGDDGISSLGYPEFKYSIYLEKKEFGIASSSEVLWIQMEYALNADSPPLFHSCELAKYLITNLHFDDSNKKHFKSAFYLKTDPDWFPHFEKTFKEIIEKKKKYLKKNTKEQLIENEKKQKEYEKSVSYTLKEFLKD